MKILRNRQICYLGSDNTTARISTHIHRTWFDEHLFFFGTQDDGSPMLEIHRIRYRRSCSNGHIMVLGTSDELDRVVATRINRVRGSEKVTMATASNLDDYPLVRSELLAREMDMS